MQTIETTVNQSLKYPATEEKLAGMIKSGKKEDKYIAHIFALFSDVPVQDIIAFCYKHDINLMIMEKYYNKYVKHLYPNHELEEVFAYQ